LFKNDEQGQSSLKLAKSFLEFVKICYNRGGYGAASFEVNFLSLILKTQTLLAEKFKL